MLKLQPKEKSAGGHSWLSSGRARLLAGLALLSILIVAASYDLGWLGENFHVVIPGCVYRSGQLSPKSLAKRVGREGICSLINLRGPNPGQSWYDEECAVARWRDVRFYDLPVDSQCPTTLELRELLDVLEHCPKPVLIHCQSGIDRSGMVAAICILLLDESGSLSRARAHLGWRYGHMPWCENLAVQERFLEGYQNWLIDHGHCHDRSHFRDWLQLVCERGDALGGSRTNP